MRNWKHDLIQVCSPIAPFQKSNLDRLAGVWYHCLLGQFKFRVLRILKSAGSLGNCPMKGFKAYGPCSLSHIGFSLPEFQPRPGSSLMQPASPPHECIRKFAKAPYHFARPSSKGICLLISVVWNRQGKIYSQRVTLNFPAQAAGSN